MIHVVVDHKSGTALEVRLDQTSKAIRAGLSKGIRAGAIYLTTVLKKDVLSGQVLRQRSGNLSRSIFHKMESPMTGVVGVGKEAPYGRMLNYGTRPHIIEAKPGKTLAFTPGGVAHAIRTSGFVKARSIKKTIAANAIFRKRVMHPGTAPYRFMELGLAMATPGVREEINKRIDAAVATGKEPTS